MITRSLLRVVNDQGWIEQAHKDKDQQDVEKQMFPPCNVEWSQAEGSRLWCTNKSGGISRDWVGRPRSGLQAPADSDNNDNNDNNI